MAEEVGIANIHTLSIRQLCPESTGLEALGKQTGRLTGNNMKKDHDREQKKNKKKKINHGGK